MSPETLEPQQWVENYADMMYRFTLVRVKDPEAAENSALAKVLAKCLSGLPEKLHKLFVLKEIDGLSSEEICKEFNIKPTNLWVILHRTRNQLKLCLESNWLNTKLRFL